jgi:hypothetical protein
MSETLPRAIADLCGILMGDTRRSTFQTAPVPLAVALVEDGEGLWTLTHNSDNVGWINKVKITNRDGYKYRAMSTHGEVKLCHSLNHAKEWLLEEYA